MLAEYPEIEFPRSVDPYADGTGVSERLLDTLVQLTESPEGTSMRSILCNLNVRGCPQSVVLRGKAVANEAENTKLK